MTPEQARAVNTNPGRYPHGQLAEALAVMCREVDTRDRTIHGLAADLDRVDAAVREAERARFLAGHGVTRVAD